jgi:hypothetical protein
MSSAEVRSLCQELFGGVIPGRFESSYAAVAGDYADIAFFDVFRILYRSKRSIGVLFMQSPLACTHDLWTLKLNNKLLRSLQTNPNNN